jgi:hypothetical protein
MQRAVTEGEHDYRHVSGVCKPKLGELLDPPQPVVERVGVYVQVGGRRAAVGLLVEKGAQRLLKLGPTPKRLSKLTSGLDPVDVSRHSSCGDFLGWLPITSGH